MREIDWQPGQGVKFGVLQEGKDTAATLPGRILEFSGKRMRIVTDAKVPGGAAIRVEWDGQLVLGEVLNLESNGFWFEIHHALADTAGLDWQKAGWQRA